MLIWHRDTLFDKTIKEMRTHSSGDNGCDTNTISPALDAEASAEANQSPFGGMVGRCIGPGTSRGSRGNIDDVSRVLPPHHRHRSLGQQERTAQIDINNLVPLLNAHLIDRDGTIDRCTVDHDVQASEMRFHCFDSFKDGLCIAHITL